MVPSGRLQWGTTSGQRHRVQLQARARSVPLEHTSDVRTVVATVHRHRSAVPEQERRPEEVAVDENALRACGDASFAELDGSMLDGSSPGGAGGNVSVLNLDIGVVMNEGDHIRNHLQLLNLAVQRLGGWPKDVGEYQRLQADLEREFLEAMEGVVAIEKLELKDFGSGKAMSNEDQLDVVLGGGRVGS